MLLLLLLLLLLLSGGGGHDAPLLFEKQIGCLMYADDLVILSTSRSGLQNSLNKLNTYCNTWKLAINHSKSKIMCLSKQGKLNTETFTINGQHLEEVKHYPYLGIEISNTGNFNVAQKSLNEKAQRALFKLKKLLYGSNLKPYVGLKLFDQLIKPICLYGAEIWGPKHLSISDSLENDGSLEHSFEKLLCEKLNISFSKFLLGVHKKSQNSAVRGELGRPPLGISIVTAITKYKLRLEFLDRNTILSEAYELSNCMSLHQKNCWGPSTKHLTSFLTKHSRLDDTMLCNKKLLKRFLSSNYVLHWKENIKKEAKMRTYTTFKNDFVYESYLNMSNESQRKSLTRFRISAHRLAIERGRYTTPPTPAEKRLCKYCTMQTVEDEYHFLMTCGNYDQLRSDLTSKVLNSCEKFNLLTEQDQFIYMMSAEEQISVYVAEYINDAFSKRLGGVICTN